LSALKKPAAKSSPEKPAAEKAPTGKAPAGKAPTAKAGPAKGGKAATAGSGKKAEKAAVAPKADAAKPTFMTRFQAWWHGHELEASAPAAKSAKPPSAPETVDQTPPAADDSPISAAVRMQIAQMVWTTGFVWPGGEELALDLAKPLGLDSSSTLIEIGSGLGGGARAIAESLGTYVTGFDFDPEVAAEAMIQATVHSLEEKAKVSPIDPQKPALRKDFFRAAMVREALYRVEDKRTLLAELVASVKKDQPIVMFDLFAGAAEPSKILTDWIALEPYPIHLWQVDRVIGLLVENHLEIRVNQDDTEMYCAMALRAWSEFVERLEGAKMTKDLVIPLVHEVELWARRIAALQSGDLKVQRLVGIKRVPVS